MDAILILGGITAAGAAIFWQLGRWEKARRAAVEQAAQELGLQPAEGGYEGLVQGVKVRILHTSGVSGGTSNTEVRAEVPNPIPYELEIHQASAVPRRDVRLEAEFDRDCEVHTPDPEPVREVLSHPELAYAVREFAQPRRYGHLFWWVTRIHHDRVVALICDGHQGKGRESILRAAQLAVKVARLLSR